MNVVRFKKCCRAGLCRRERSLRGALLRFLFVGFLVLAGMTPSALGASDPVPQAVPPPVLRAPPPAPPIQTRRVPKATVPRALPSVPTLYSIGSPTDEEQLYLELINRARADPVGEGIRLKNTPDPMIRNAITSFGVDLALMVSQFSTISPQPPLSMNAKLLNSARLHSQDMFDHNFQGHTNFSDGGLPASRIAAQQYNAIGSGENVYAFAQSVLYGHAGFEVDWGGDPATQGGMQTPPGHRDTLHDGFFLEVGIGVVNGRNGQVGPQLVTQDFATEFGTSTFITGVVYYDFNNNGFYDVGEGIGGVTVKVAGENYYAVTADSGGYSVPVLNGNFAVTFTATNLSNQVSAVVSGGNPVKQDYRPGYTPPTISGSALVSAGQVSAFTFSPVGAATNYQWRQSRRVAFTAVEGAENGLTTNVTITASSGYPVVTNEVKNSGAFSFHLAHPSPAPSTPPVAQVLMLNRRLLPSATSELLFASRLGYAATGEVARCQISTTDGRTWQDLWTQAGTDGSGEMIFTNRSISLAAFAGQEVLLQFVFDYTDGTFYSPDTNGGFYLDDIAVSAAEELVEPVVTNIPTGTAFNFSPANPGGYSLRARAKVGNRLLDYGPAKLISASPVLITRTILNGVPQTLLDFQLTSGTAGTFQLLSSPNMTGPWTIDSSAVFQILTNNLFYRVTTRASGMNQRFYLIQMSP